jgi:hypothetical protein
LGNKHPHEFRHGKGKRLVDVIGPIGLQDQVLGDFQDEAVLTVADFIGKRKLPIRILYRYDFADEWIHEIVFEKREAGEGGPVMFDGARACPPEDFGGTFQYMQALHGEIEWMNPGYDPEAFDPKAVSFEAKNRLRGPAARLPRCLVRVWVSCWSAFILNAGCRGHSVHRPHPCLSGVHLLPVATISTHPPNGGNRGGSHRR